MAGAACEAQHVAASLLAPRHSRGTSCHPGQSMDAHMDFPMVLSIPCIWLCAVFTAGQCCSPLWHPHPAHGVMIWQS